MKRTRLCELLGIEYPIIQAPMDWITNAELVAAVSNAGGLGVLGPNAGQRTVITSPVETGERLRQEIRKTKSLTGKPFAVNVISNKGKDEFSYDHYSTQCVRVVLEEGVPAVVLVGDGPGTYIESLKQAGITVLHRLISVTRATAVEAEQAGVDAVVCVGVEGGGHPGSVSECTSVLLPQIVDAVDIPVAAGGGIADGRGVVAVLALGAECAYLGTRFMATTECPAHENLKRAIVEAGDTSTVLLPSTLGGMRALKSPITARCLEMQEKGCSLREITDTYHSGYLKGMIEGDAQAGTFVCGAGCGLVTRVLSAAEVVGELMAEVDQGLERLAALRG
jgi:enoyl-[acyl-carrier protein] reductase II